MSEFSDMVKADIDNVFLNEDEFGERHNIDGVDCIAVLSDYSSTGNILESGSSVFPVKLSTKTSNLSDTVIKGGLLIVDGVNYIIDDVSSIMGMTDVVLRRNM